MNRRTWLLIAVTAGIAAAVFHFPAIPQDTAYHNFADIRTIVGIPNALNVLSNVFFVLIGVMGMKYVLRPSRVDDPHAFIDRVERWPYFIFFVGVALTAFGSSYYHWIPNNSTLVWDRLPMTVGFMSLLAAMIGERISVKAGILSLAPLLVSGFVSVFWWDVTEMRGHGDLRLYALAQFGSLVVLLLLIALFPARYTRGSDFVAALGFYALAKVLESLDRPIFAFTHGLVSGHSLKHVAAAGSAYWILRMLRLRVPIRAAVSNA